jgi:hypothetical protein
MQNEMAQKAASQAEANSYRNYLNQTANTNLRRREGDSMDRYRTGDIDVRREDVGGMNEFRRGQVTNEGNRIQSNERINDRTVRGQESIANIGANANKYMSDNQLTGSKYMSDNQLTGNKYVSDNALTGSKYMSDNQLTGQKEAVRGQMYVSDNALTGSKYMSDNQLSGIRDSNTASMFNTDRMAGANENIASLPFDRLNARDRAVVEAFGPQALNPQSENLRMLQMSNQNEQESAFQNALNDQARRNLEDYNGIDPLWDSEQKKSMKKHMKAGMSPEGAARKVAIDELTPLYGRSSGMTNQSQQQPPPPESGGTNNVPSFNKTQLGTRFRIVPTQR